MNPRVKEPELYSSRKGYILYGIKETKMSKSTWASVDKQNQIHKLYDEGVSILDISNEVNVLETVVTQVIEGNYSFTPGGKRKHLSMEELANSIVDTQGAKISKLKAKLSEEEKKYLEKIKVVKEELTNLESDYDFVKAKEYLKGKIYASFHT